MSCGGGVECILNRVIGIGSQADIWGRVSRTEGTAKAVNRMPVSFEQQGGHGPESRGRRKETRSEM